MSAFFVALQFLTRLPSPIRREISLDEVGASIGWFPAVGAALGIILVTFDTFASRILAASVVDALLVLSLVALTGGLHLDGVIDTFDGFAAGPNPESQLAAMRQTHAGAYGALAGVLMLLATYAAISALSAPLRAATLFIAPIAGRTAILIAYYLYPYARPDPGVSQSLKRGATLPRALAGLTTAAALVGATGAFGGLAALILILGWTHVVARAAIRRLGGLTGDVLGMICESSQLLALLAVPTLRFP